MINEEITHEELIPNFRKIPVYGSVMFSCDVCGQERIYGAGGFKPENHKVVIICEGNCKRNTPHTFIRIHLLGRPERTWI